MYIRKNTQTANNNNSKIYATNNNNIRQDYPKQWNDG